MTDATPVPLLTGLESCQLLAAFQVLTLPSGALGVSHKVAKAAVLTLTGRKVRGKPPKGTRDLSQFLTWHMGVIVTEGEPPPL
jgi:hypothetical protein